MKRVSFSWAVGDFQLISDRNVLFWSRNTGSDTVGLNGGRGLTDRLAPSYSHYKDTTATSLIANFPIERLLTWLTVIISHHTELCHVVEIFDCGKEIYGGKDVQTRLNVGEEIGSGSLC